MNNGVVKHINGERREGCVIIAEKPTGDEWKRNTSMFMDVIFASGASSVKEKFTIGNNVIAMGVVDGNSHIAFEMFGCVVAKDNGLSDKEILHKTVRRMSHFSVDLGRVSQSSNPGRSHSEK